MTLEQLIAQKRGEIATLLTERHKHTAELAEIRGKAEATEADEARVTELRTLKDGIDAQVRELEVKVSEYEAERATDNAVDARSQVITPGAPSPNERKYDEVARVGSEERTYAPHKERMWDRSRNEMRAARNGQPLAVGGTFARDVAAAFMGDYAARDKLARHMQEERVERPEWFGSERAVGTGAFAGLTVPQYLTDLYAPAVAAGRPFANICRAIPLPADGMTVNISRITTSTSVGTQSTENSAVTEQNADDTLLTESVLTAGGQQTMSRQSIDRSTGAESIIMDDLFRRYSTNLDGKLLNDATTGLTNVAQAVAYTDASPTAAELYPKLLNGAANVEAVYLDQGVSRMVAVMHSRRFYWLQSQVGTSWPFFGQPGIPTQQGGVNYANEYGSGFRGILPNGMPVVVDNNLATNLGAGTNEDEVYIVNADECFLWEDPSAPMFIRAEQPAAASLGVLLVVFGYFAYSHRRYTNGHQKVNGTGLVTPTF